MKNLLTRILRSWFPSLIEVREVERIVYRETPSLISPEIVGVAKGIVEAVQLRLPRASGEAKRHQAYAELLKTLPDVPKRDISLAIELALRS